MEALRLEVRQRAEGLDLLRFNCKSDSRILIASALHVVPMHLMFVANVILGGKIAGLKWELLISFPFHDNARKRRSWCNLATV